MKKTIVFAALSAVMLITVSCGSLNKVSSGMSAYNGNLQGSNSSNVQTRTMRAEEPCQALAQERLFAAAGTAISFNEKVARNEAIRDARYELGRMVQVAVEGAAKDYLKNTTMNKKSTAETVAEEINKQFFAELVSNSKVIKTTVYDLSDGQIQVYACVEIANNFKETLAQMTKVAKNVLSSDEETKAKFDEQHFEKEMQEEMDNYKKERYNK